MLMLLMQPEQLQSDGLCAFLQQQIALTDHLLLLLCDVCWGQMCVD